MSLAMSLAVSLATSVVGAQTSPQATTASARTSSLGWTRLPGAESCVSARDLALDVEARLGRAAFIAPAAADLTLEGRVEPATAPSAFRATIRLLDQSGALLGTRELETSDPTCRDLADPVALAVALMIDPDAATEAAPPPPAPKAAPAAAPWVGAPRLDEPRGAEPTPRAPPPWRFQVDGGAASVVGMLPRPAVGFRLRTLLDPEGFPAIAMSGTYFPAVAGGGTYELVYGALAVCPWTPDFEVVRLTTCAALAVGVIEASGGLGSRVDPAVHPAVTAGVSRRLLGPVVGTVDAGLAVPLSRRTYHYGEAFTISPVAGTLDLGVGVEVP